MPKYLVTGGAGFIGSNLVDVLLKKGHEVLVIDNLSTGKKENLNSEAIFFEKDIRNYDDISPLFKGIDFVIHLAALPRVMVSIEKPSETNDINVKGTLNVLLAAKESGVKRLVYASSTSIYGDQEVMPIKETFPAGPLSPYGVQKYVGELYCNIFPKIFNLSTVSLRFFNVFGPKQDPSSEYSGVVAKFFQQRKEGKPLTIVGDGGQKRDFTYVFDVVSAIIAATEKDVCGGEAINIASGNNFSINQLAEIIGGEKIYLPKRPGEIRDSLADISKAKELLGWVPEYNLEKGLREMMEKYGY
jgi:UDP-glucose 4-epimerase